ncbi:DUF4350 domain-containing protein [Ornithinibacillus bavariensis]|uniref:DUF4350 domain-containing protein n=1 Tax=Ornithinibacillus bavariensis TaxID=545502 RepID=UPI000EEFCF20|nr:DUF4350 domain-containing protein [Ornithinibacillus sp.]
MNKSVKQTWAWIVTLVIIFGTVSLFLGSKKPVEYSPYISTSPSPTGVKAFYTYMEEEGIPIKRLKEAPLSNDNEQEKLLLMIEPTLLSNQEARKDYESFVKTGNALVIFKRNLEGMFDIKTTFGMSDEEAVTIKDQNGEEYKATMLTQTRILPDESDEVLLEDDFGAIAIKRNIGEGTLIAVNSPDWLTNQFILENDNLNLVFQLLEEPQWNTILVDEYSHQSTKKQAIFEVYPMWLLVGSLQLIIVTLLWLLYKGKRFGPILRPREEMVRFSDEHITALAAWYQKGKLYRDSLHSQASYLRSIFQEKWGISYQKDWEDIQEQLLLKVSSMNREAITSFVKEIDTVLKKPDISKQEYLLWSTRIDQLRKEVEEG